MQKIRCTSIHNPIHLYHNTARTMLHQELKDCVNRQWQIVHYTFKLYYNSRQNSFISCFVDFFYIPIVAKKHVVHRIGNLSVDIGNAQGIISVLIVIRCASLKTSSPHFEGSYIVVSSENLSRKFIPHPKRSCKDTHFKQDSPRSIRFQYVRVSSLLMANVVIVIIFFVTIG